MSRGANLTNNVFTQVHCGHVLKFSGATPLYGDIVFCFRCDTWRTVVGSSVEWMWNCENCKRNISRGYGADKRAATRGAGNHSRKFGHAVILRHGNEWWTVGAELTGQSTLDDEMTSILANPLSAS